MSIPIDILVSALVTLFVVVDRMGVTPAFLGVTAGLPRPARRRVALRACLIAFAILTGAADRRLAAADAVELAAGVPHRGRAAAVFDCL